MPLRFPDNCLAFCDICNKPCSADDLTLLTEDGEIELVCDDCHYERMQHLYDAYDATYPDNEDLE